MPSKKKTTKKVAKKAVVKKVPQVDPQKEVDSKKEEVRAKLKVLGYDSMAAKMRLPMQKETLNALKIEQEILKVAKEAGQLIEFELADFLFFGYIERMNRELLGFPARIKNETTLMIQDAIKEKLDPGEVAERIIKIIVREFEAIIRETKKDQKRDVQEWAK